MHSKANCCFSGPKVEMKDPYQDGANSCYGQNESGVKIREDTTKNEINDDFFEKNEHYEEETLQFSGNVANIKIEEDTDMKNDSHGLEMIFQEIQHSNILDTIEPTDTKKMKCYLCPDGNFSTPKFRCL